jgi:hypothetical protein
MSYAEHLAHRPGRREVPLMLIVGLMLCASSMLSIIITVRH